MCLLLSVKRITVCVTKKLGCFSLFAGSAKFIKKQKRIFDLQLRSRFRFLIIAVLSFNIDCHVHIKFGWYPRDYVGLFNGFNLIYNV